MKAKLFACVFVFCSSITFVVGQKARSFTIKPGEKIESIVPDSINYSYPSFLNGTVYFKDNRRVNARLNYSSLFEEIMFISPQGDTMALDNGPAISYVVINTDTFYFDDFFVKSEGSYGDIKLASREFFSIVDVNAVGAMGNNAPSSVTTYGTLLTRGDRRELTRQEVLKIRKETRYYGGDRFNNFTLVNRKSLADLFPGKSKQAKEYLKNHSVSFDNKEELKKMITFLQAN